MKMPQVRAGIFPVQCAAIHLAQSAPRVRDCAQNKQVLRPERIPGSGQYL